MIINDLRRLAMEPNGERKREEIVEGMSKMNSNEIIWRFLWTMDGLRELLPCTLLTLSLLLHEFPQSFPRNFVRYSYIQVAQFYVVCMSYEDAPRMNRRREMNHYVGWGRLHCLFSTPHIKKWPACETNRRVVIAGRFRRKQVFSSMFSIYYFEYIFLFLRF